VKQKSDLSISSTNKDEIDMITANIFNNHYNSKKEKTPENNLNSNLSNLVTKTPIDKPTSFSGSLDFIQFKNNENKNEEIEEINETTNPTKIIFNYKAPWLSEETKKHSGIIRLHYEILDFYNFMKPTAKEDELRIQTIKEFKQLIKNNMKDVQIKTFGSFPNRLHLPDSDIDVVVFSSNPNYENEFIHEKKILEKISTILINNDTVDYIKKIDAKVPILKIKMKSTGIYMDIW